jgi:hypothetical protein
MKFEMAERDSWWSIFLHEQYGMQDAVDRLLDWAWSPEKKDHISDEAVRLCGVALAWFLTTSNRFLRDRATKALVNLLTERIHVLQALVRQFLGVNDPYVLERLLAIAYGCSLRNTNDEAIGELAQDIYDWIFRNGEPPVHILSRGYARGIIEHALHRDIEFDVEVGKIRPPHQSEWLLDIPEPEEIEEYGKWWEGMPDDEWSRVAIHSSVTGFGDFARYVIGSPYGISKWLPLRLDEPHWRTPEERLAEFIDSLTLPLTEP